MGDVDDLLQQIKECWPKFTIAKENILRPTQEVVFRFYSNFIHDYNEKIAYLTGVSTTFNINVAHCEPEEQLFLQLSRLMGKIGGLKFTLPDIYQPISIRTKNFFKLCIHFITFTEYLQGVTDVLTNTVFNAREDIAKLLLEQQELIDENNDNAKSKAELSENKSLLEREFQSVRQSYNEMKTLKASKEKMYAEKRKLTGNLKQELQNEEYKLKRVEDMEKDLLEQRITEREHQNVLHTVAALKSESEMLDSYDTGLEDGLEHENKVLQHSADCIRLLNKFDFIVENIKELIHKEDELKVIINSLDKVTSTKTTLIKHKKVKSEQEFMAFKKQFADLQSEYKTITDKYTDNLNLFSRELNQLKDCLQKRFSDNCKIILEYEKDTVKLEENLDKMKKAFATEYVRVSKVEKVVVDKFKEMLMKFKGMEQ